MSKESRIPMRRNCTIQGSLIHPATEFAAPFAFWAMCYDDAFHPPILPHPSSVASLNWLVRMEPTERLTRATRLRFTPSQDGERPNNL